MNRDSQLLNRLQQFEQLATTEERLRYLEHVAWMGVYSQKLLRKSILEIKSELVDSIREFIHMTVAVLQKEQKFVNVDIRDSIHLHARLMSVPQIIDILYEKFEEYEIKRIHQEIQDTYEFLNFLEINSTDPYVKEFLHTSDHVEHILRRRSFFADKAPQQLRDILRLEFQVPEYLNVCSNVDYYVVLFTGYDENNDTEVARLLMSYRTEAEFKQDREIFAYARDHEAKVLEQMLYPMTEEDLFWLNERMDKWNQQIAIIHEVETHIGKYRDHLYSMAKGSFEQHVGR
jgi:hypothetical protein